MFWLAELFLIPDCGKNHNLEVEKKCSFEVLFYTVYLINKLIVKKIVIFGSGKIGRSFIGQLFGRAGYEVVFVDIDQKLIEELNRKRAYTVVVKGATEERFAVENVRGVLIGRHEVVASEIADADIIAVSVGQKGLPSVIPPLGKGLRKRHALDESLKIDIIIAENMRNAAEYIKSELRKCLPSDYPFDFLVGLAETSIGKMVPIMKQADLEEDPLQVFAEPYNTLIVDAKGFKTPIPKIEGLEPKENMKAWVDRKLFIHNLGHATTAYLGFALEPHNTRIWEVLNNPSILQKVRATMLQAAAILMKLHPGEFTEKGLASHIDDLLERFANKALGDTVFRVGCDLERKLGPNDRLVPVIKAGLELSLPVELIFEALLQGIDFKATDESGAMLPADQAFHTEKLKGLEHVLTVVCKFTEEELRKLRKIADF